MKMYFACRSPLLPLAGLILSLRPAPLLCGADVSPPTGTAAAPAALPTHWSVVNSGDATTLSQVIWTGAQFVAAGGDTVMTSPDGLKWTAKHLGPPSSLFAIAANNGACVALSLDGAILTSQDLVNWAGRQPPDLAARASPAGGAPPTAERLVDIAYTGTSFEIVGEHGSILRSTNGETWGAFRFTFSPSGIPAQANSGNSTFHRTDWTSGNLMVAAAADGLWYRLKEPVSGYVHWDKAPYSTANMHDVAWNGSVFVAVGNQPTNLYSSDDALNWTRRNSGVSADLLGVTQAGGQFVAVGANGTIITSPDGANWSPGDANSKSNLTSVAANGKIFVAVSDSGAVLVSPPLAGANFTSAALTPLHTPNVYPPPAASPGTPEAGPPGALDRWTVASSGEATQYWQIAWQENAFVCVGNDGTLLSSPDGAVWKKARTNTTAQFQGTTGNGKINVAVGLFGTVVTSPDLETWTTQPAPTTERLFAVLWQGAQFVALGNNGTVILSPDGLAWRSAPQQSSTIFYHHGVWAGRQFIVASGNGLSTSADGLAWRTAPGVSSKMYDVAANSSLAVAVGESPNNLVTSPDGIRWTRQSPPSPEMLAAVTWTGTQFLAAGANDTLLSSPDGIIWTAHRTGTGLFLNGIAQHGDTTVIATRTGEILVNKLLEKVAAPEISLAPGVPGSVPQLLLTCPTPGAKIYVTDDGREPTVNTTLYTGPFTVPHPGVVKARAFKDNAIPSDLASAQFTPGPISP